MKKLPKLERYNQIVWAVIGSGVIVVAAISALMIVAAILYALLKPDRGAVPVEVIEGAAPATQKLARYDFCHPISVHGSPYQLIRIAGDRFVVRNRGGMLRQKYDAFSSKESSYYETCGIYGSQGPSAIVNVLFRHADHGGMHLLLPQNAVVHAVEYPQPPSGRSRRGVDGADSFPPRGMLYWEISFEDSNGDNVIDERDDQGVYLSDADGRNLARVTPPLSRVLQKSYDGKRNLLLMRIVRDTNGDKSIDEKDSPSLIEVSMAQRKIKREVLDAAKVSELMQEATSKREATRTP